LTNTTIWRLSGKGFDYIHKPIGFDWVFNSKSIFMTTENHHAGETFMLASLLFTLAWQWSPQFFHFRIATAPKHPRGDGTESA